MGAMGEKVFADLAANSLQWIPELGIGFHPAVDTSIYDAEYVAKYTDYECTPMAHALTRARLDLVKQFGGTGQLVDVGVGSGQFMRARGGNTFGYDINPITRQWLVEDGWWHNPYFSPIHAASFWDSLEHIPNPKHLLGHVQEFVFVSAPIYRDLEHVQSSKHYRPGEHCWYWTDDGIRNFMDLFGFAQNYQDTRESDLGREDIGTYVFQRIK